MANGAMCWTLASKSKSNPSKATSPKGRRALEPSCLGPKVSHISFAPSLASSSDLKPPSLYVAPPIERRIVLFFFWHVAISLLHDVSRLAPTGFSNTYATEGQFFNWVPSKTSQSLLVTEKSISGAPPGPLTIMLKAIGITYVILLAQQFKDSSVICFLH